MARKTRRKRKGRMPAALLAYWANKRRRSRKAGNAPVAKKKNRTTRRRARRGRFTRSATSKRYTRRRGFAFVPAGTLPLVGGAVAGISVSSLAASLLPATSSNTTRRAVGLGTAFAGYMATKRFSPGVARGMIVGAGAALLMDLFSAQINSAAAAIKKATGLKGLGDMPDAPQIGAASFDIEQTGVGDYSPDAQTEDNQRFAFRN